MDERLLSEVLTRLDADQTVDSGTALWVLAACEDRLGEVLGGAALEPPAVDAAADAEPVGAYLAEITVEGFRGIGERRKIPLQPGPGLTLVVGRNGSGKSSVAEAVEVVLTGTNQRWAGKSKAWAEAWRNLHRPDSARLQVALVEEGQPGPTLLTRAWPPGAAFADAATTVRRAGRDDEPFAVLGWESDLVRYRPILSYNELGRMLDGKPSELYDALASILGMEDVRAAGERLRQARLASEQLSKDVLKGVRGVLEAAARIDDPRADAIRSALQGKPPAWDLDAVEAQLVEDDAEVTSDVARLRGLATLQAPRPDAAEAAATRLEAAVAEAARVEGTDAGRAGRLADLLVRALACVEHDGEQMCPVCGGNRLDAAWLAGAQDEVARLRAEAQAATAAAKELAEALAGARRLVVPVPDVVVVAHHAGIDAEALEAAWAAWAEAPDDPAALVVHLRSRPGDVAALAEDVREAARRALEARQEAWRPVAAQVARFVGEARDARVADARAKRLKVAEDWMKRCSQSIEEDRFAPIRDRTKALWDALRLDSAVSFDGMTLVGGAVQRSVTLDVSVDEAGASALGVMSQGELHALALSIFLPRATLDESPFRFVLIDDPVQAMDPARVDGLARVLEDVARTRQVVVFTHDARLPEAVRRLGIDARTLVVTRRPESFVEVTPELDPVQRYVEDARAVASTNELPREVAAVIVPTLCRSAVEAACVEAVRRRRLKRGEPHDEVEALVERTRTTNDLAALALHDDRERGKDVLPKLDQWGKRFADAYRACKEGAHVGGSSVEDLKALVRDAGDLAARIQALP